MNGVVWIPPKGTYPRFSIETLKELDENNEIWFGADGKATPSRKTFLSEAKEGVTPTTIWPYREVGHNHEANNELKDLGLTGLFENPKPTRLIKRMISLSTRPDQEDIILDFFSGSGTTGHAVLEIKNEEYCQRRFILIQLPELCDVKSEAAKAGYRTIADITKERVRRVVQKKNETDASKLPLGATQDRGFRVFKLAESNFKPWDAQSPTDTATLARQLELHIEHIREGRSPQDILYEILLKSGFPLTTPVETLTLAGKQVFSVAGGALLICLEPQLTMEVIRALAAQKPERVVCLDSGFAGNDQLKANAVQIFKTQAIPSFKTV